MKKERLQELAGLPITEGAANVPKALYKHAEQAVSNLEEASKHLKAIVKTSSGGMQSSFQGHAVAVDEILSYNGGEFGLKPFVNSLKGNVNESVQLDEDLKSDMDNVVKSIVKMINNEMKEYPDDDLHTVVSTVLEEVKGFVDAEFKGKL